MGCFRQTVFTHLFFFLMFGARRRRMPDTGGDADELSERSGSDAENESQADYEEKQNDLEPWQDFVKTWSIL